MQPLDDNALVKMKTVRAVVAALKRSMPRFGPGLGMRQGKDGPVWAVDASQFTTSHPFKAPATASASTVLVPGQVNGTDIVDFPADFTLNVSTSGVRYVYIVATITQTVSSYGYVTGHTLTSWTLATGYSVPADSATTVHRTVCRYDDGVLTEQAVVSSLEFVIRDDGSGSSTGVAIWGQA